MKDFMYLFKDKEPIHTRMSPPLEERGGKTITGRNKVVTDGPFPEAKELVGGYLLVQVKDLDEAVELAKNPAEIRLLRGKAVGA